MEKIRLYGGIALFALVLLLLALGIFYAYNTGFGDPAQARRAVEEYFTALGEGDYDAMYELTPDASLTDPFGRKITRTDFSSQVRALGGGRPLTINETKIEALGQKDGAYYFKITLLYQVGGTSKSRSILVEVVQEGGEWKVTYPFLSTL